MGEQITWTEITSGTRKALATSERDRPSEEAIAKHDRRLVRND